MNVEKIEFTELEDLGRISVNQNEGWRGLLAATSAGLDGAHLSVQWDEKGQLAFSIRTSDSTPVQSFAWDAEGVTTVQLTRRGTCLYVHGLQESGMEPLLAINFPLDAKLQVGGLGDRKSTERPMPTLSQVPATHTLTTDLALPQVGTVTKGEWAVEPDATSLNGSHLSNKGNHPDASLNVSIRGLLSGEHEFWVRYPANERGTPEAEAVVSGFPISHVVALNQQIGSQVWVALGRFHTAAPMDARLSLHPTKPGSGAIRLDAIHSVWSGWEDQNKDGIPDGLTLAQWQVMTGQSGVLLSATGARETAADHARDADLATLSSSLEKNGRAVVYVSGSIGDDAADGSRADFAGARPETSRRQGPKRTLRKALEAAGGATDIEVHIDGAVSMGDPFAATKGLNPLAGIRFVSGSEGAILTVPLPPGVKPPELPPIVPPPSPPSIVTTKLPLNQHEK